jgi:hypothetical protein
MLRQSELLLLAAWCREREMTWLPGDAGGRRAALLLERRGRRADAMLLVLETGELRLLDSAAQELAAASDLQALLDAVDGGVADQPQRLTWPGRGASTTWTVQAA